MGKSEFWKQSIEDLKTDVNKEINQEAVKKQELGKEFLELFSSELHAKQDNSKRGELLSEMLETKKKEGDLKKETTIFLQSLV